VKTVEESLGGFLLADRYPHFAGHILAEQYMAELSYVNAHMFEISKYQLGF